jgi:HSP20 family protein
MSVLRFEPFRDPFREVDRLFNTMMSGTRVPQGMPMDVYRAEDSYVVELDLPGVDPNSVDVTVERGSLTVKAERRPTYGEGQQVLVAERPQGSFTRQLALGEGLEPEGLRAEYADGVLRLTIPLAAQEQPRRVQISHSGGQRTIQGQTETAGGSTAESG